MSRSAEAGTLSQSYQRAPDPSRTCVVVRMFNESAVVGSVVQDLKRTFSTVIAVDDGSGDHSYEVARRAGAIVVRHPINLGAGAALQTGLEVALTLPSVDYIVTFDADGQHRVEDALAMVLAAQTSRVDVLIGSRFLEDSKQIPARRRAILRSAVLFTRVTTGLSVTDTHCGLRVFNRRAAGLIDLRLRGMAYASELMHLIKTNRLNLSEYPVRVEYTEYSRLKGQRNINAVNIAFDLLMRALRAPA